MYVCTLLYLNPAVLSAAEKIIESSAVLYINAPWIFVMERCEQYTPTSFFNEINNDPCLILLAQSTVTGNSWQQECSLSLLICLYRTQLHHWLAAFFIQQLPVNKHAANHPPILHLWSLGISVWPPYAPEQSLWAFLKGSFQKVIFRGNGQQFN